MIDHIRTTVVAGIALLALSGGSFAGPSTFQVKTTDEVSDIETASEPVEITSRTGTELTGQAMQGDIAVNFSANQISADHVEVEFTIGDSAVSVNRHLGNGTIEWGAGGDSLTLAEIEAAGAVYEDLVPEWRSAAAGRGGIDGKFDLVVRAMAFLSEAPPEFALEDTEQMRPQVGVLQDAHFSSSAPALTLENSMDACTDAVIAQTAPKSEEQQAGIAACQVSNDNGLLYFPCTKKLRYLNHDSNNHCFQSQSVWTGPGTTACMAECGPGCNGLNFYTQDCGDHDRCGRDHGGSLNPADPECGDEWREAGDDFMLGWPKC